jgi:enterochelin esterase-like enzyme
MPTTIPTTTPLACLNQPGRVSSGVVQTTKPAQEFLIYLPPCYDFKTDQRYPVLYLLHGQTYIDDQWARLGAPAAADNLINSGNAQPFIMVFPDDRYWNVEAGPDFGDRFINGVIPYVDSNFRTIADRQHRALGGLSRGGGWTIKLGLTRYDLFGTLGFHSPAIFVEDAAYIDKWLTAIPHDQWPRIWIDAGDHDSQLGLTKQFENMLSQHAIPHEWHMFTGDHSETYWQAHVAEYIQWYADGWSNDP